LQAGFNGCWTRAEDFDGDFDYEPFGRDAAGVGERVVMYLSARRIIAGDDYRHVFLILGFSGDVIAPVFQIVAIGNAAYRSDYRTGTDSRNFE